MDSEIINGFHIDVPLDSILMRLGKRKKTQMSPSLKKRIIELIKQNKNLIETAGIFRINDFTLSKEGKVKQIIIDNFLSISSKSLYELLKDSKKIIVFACTIGNKLTDKVNSLMKAGNMSDAVIIDAFGSEAVESCAEYIQDYLKMKLRLEGYKLTRRYSPGYGDLPLSDQPFILQFIHAEDINIRTNSSNIMNPEKSITAFIGVEQ